MCAAMCARARDDDVRDISNCARVLLLMRGDARVHVAQ
jgi:hypothetical protein